MRDLVKAAILAAMLSNGADLGQSAVARLMDVGRGDVFAATRSFGDGRAMPVGFAAAKPVRFGW